VGKIDKNKDMFKTALTQILQKSKHVILITQPPVLPKYASREKIRELGNNPIFEDTLTSNLRKDTNTFLLSEQNDRVHVLEINSLFEKTDGELYFTDSQGRQLYHDKEHLSAYGSDKIKKILMKEISRILALPPLTAHG
jgi:SGNH domain (fused to AT3 domains)